MYCVVGMCKEIDRLRVDLVSHHLTLWTATIGSSWVSLSDECHLVGFWVNGCRIGPEGSLEIVLFKEDN